MKYAAADLLRLSEQQRCRPASRLARVEHLCIVCTMPTRGPMLRVCSNQRGCVTAAQL